MRPARTAVLVPTITVDEWLDLAVGSVLAQSDVDVQVIVAHDGVNPDPGRPWMGHPRVAVRSTASRQGLAATLASAIADVDAEFIGRLDADDLALPGRLSAQVSYLDENPEVVAVGTRARRIDGVGRDLGSYNEAAGRDVRDLLLARNVLVHSSMLLRRTAILEAGGYDPRLRQREDYDLWLRMARLGPLANLAAELTAYRVHPGQMSRAAAPYGLSVRAVNRGRRDLARTLNVRWPTRTWHAARWNGAQVLRYCGLRRPGYDQ